MLVFLQMVSKFLMLFPSYLVVLSFQDPLEWDDYGQGTVRKGDICHFCWKTIRSNMAVSISSFFHSDAQEMLLR